MLFNIYLLFNESTNNSLTTSYHYLILWPPLQHFQQYKIWGLAKVLLVLPSGFVLTSLLSDMHCYNVLHTTEILYFNVVSFSWLQNIFYHKPWYYKIWYQFRQLSVTPTIPKRILLIVKKTSRFYLNFSSWQFYHI